jgi:hypothetical protein
MSYPDSGTWLIIIVNVLGWIATLVTKYFFNESVKYQHRAMWKEYAEKHDIPTNGKEH